MQEQKRERFEKKVFLSQDVFDEVKDYQYQNHITSQSQALLQLVLRGLLREKEHNNFMPRKVIKFSNAKENINE